MIQKKSWKITSKFWNEVKSLLPEKERDPNKVYKRAPENKIMNPNHKARRWVVEACHSWLNRFRKLLIQFEKTDVAYRGLLMFACAFITF